MHCPARAVPSGRIRRQSPRLAAARRRDARVDRELPVLGWRRVAPVALLGATVVFACALSTGWREQIVPLLTKV